MQASEHVSESAVQVATGKRTNPRREAQKLIAGMIRERKAAATNPVIAPSTKKSSAAAKSTKQIVVVRRLARDFGKAKKGTIALILDANIYGSSDGSNWLNGRTYATKEDALAAAKAAGVSVA